MSGGVRGHGDRLTKLKFGEEGRHDWLSLSEELHLHSEREVISQSRSYSNA